LLTLALLIVMGQAVVLVVLVFLVIAIGGRRRDDAECVHFEYTKKSFKK
jgi:hypothetical protein